MGTIGLQATTSRGIIQVQLGLPLGKILVTTPSGVAKREVCLDA